MEFLTDFFARGLGYTKMYVGYINGMFYSPYRMGKVSLLVWEVPSTAFCLLQLMQRAV